MVSGRMSLALAALLAAAGCTGPAGEKPAPGSGDRPRAWELVFEEDFDDDSSLGQWRLDGFAGLELATENGTSFLSIETRADQSNPENRQSVLWCRKRFPGDLRFAFRARAEPGNRSIFYFNANPAPGSGYRSIFDRKRPDAQMTRYAGRDFIEMYSVGILRDDQQVCNLRYIGGTTAAAYREYLKDPGAAAQEVYGRETIFQAFDSPFLKKPGTWFEFDLQVAAKRLSLRVEGLTVFDCEDPGNAGTPDYAWTPLTRGGWIGFRNFVPGKVCLDWVKVYRPR